MADDPLSLFRKRPLTPTPAQPHAQSAAVPFPQPQPGDTREEYKAFASKDRVEGIMIRRRKGAMSYAVMYNYIHSVVFDDDDWTKLFISVSGLHIEIRGRNVRPIVDAIRLRCCDYIQEFRADRFVVPEPIDPAAPYVESIVIEILSGEGKPEAG